MARKKEPGPAGFVLFDVVYEDGTLSSNRKVPDTEVGGLDGDLPAKTFIEQQDRIVGEKSGRPRGKIKTIVRSGRRMLPAGQSGYAAARSRC
jgi:hypothetical protein